jgi:molybdenum cofactor biosynthesis enzyme MoaA
MRIETMSIVVGTAACNAGCQFCVSKMTPPNGVSIREPEVKWSRLAKAIQFAERMGVVTVLLTGKGEPTLFPETLLAITSEVGGKFPFVELQTNGLAIGHGDFDKLTMLYGRGLTTVALSVVSHLPEINRSVYYSHRPKMDYPDLGQTIKKIHDTGLSVRLTAMMMKGGIDDTESLADFVDFARDNHVEQVTVRPITRSSSPEDSTVAKWVDDRTLSYQQLQEIRCALYGQGTLLLKLRHGAEVFDVFGQNVCLSNCLTPPQGEDIRQVIYFPDGHLRYDWQYPGAILM